SDTALETATDFVLRQIAPDEDDAALALLAVVPRPLMVAVEDHGHALEDEPLVIVLEGKDALAAQDVRALLLHQILHPGKEPVGVERLVALQRNRLHFLVVIVLEAAAVMMRVTIAVVMIVAVMVVAVALEKFRLQMEDAVEVERIAAEHFVKRHLRPLGLVQPGVAIDAADARLDLVKFGRRDQIGLVDQDDVGKRDLVLGFG